MSSGSTSRFLRKSGASLFGGVVSLRAAFYDHGILPVHRIPDLAVVSVGNIRVGGSGKTPFSIQLANMMKQRGVKTGVLLRGYRGGKEREGILVSSGTGPLVTVEDAGDEAYLASLRTEGVSIWAGANRETGARFLRDKGIELVILDDGFQRRRLHRDLDIVLASPDDIAQSTQLLPSGPLREPPDSLERAHLWGGFFRDWKDKTKQPELLINYRPSGFVGFDSGAFAPIDELAGRRVYLFSGIAQPHRFKETAEQAGLFVVGASEFRDHHKYKVKDLSELSEDAGDLDAEVLLTTEKDLVRIQEFDIQIPVFALRIEVEIRSGSELLDQYLYNILNL